MKSTTRISVVRALRHESSTRYPSAKTVSNITTGTTSFTLAPATTASASTASATKITPIDARGVSSPPPSVSCDEPLRRAPEELSIVARDRTHPRTQVLEQEAKTEDSQHHGEEDHDRESLRVSCNQQRRLVAPHRRDDDAAVGRNVVLRLQLLDVVAEGGGRVLHELSSAQPTERRDLHADQRQRRRVRVVRLRQDRERLDHVVLGERPRTADQTPDLVAHHELDQNRAERRVL